MTFLTKLANIFSPASTVSNAKLQIPSKTPLQIRQENGLPISTSPRLQTLGGREWKR